MGKCALLATIPYTSRDVEFRATNTENARIIQHCRKTMQQENWEDDIVLGVGIIK